MTPVDVHLRRVSADNVATLRRTIERRRHHTINRVPCLAVLLRSEPDSAHPVIRGPVAGLLGGRYADAVDRRHPLRRANVVVVERSQPQRCRVGRTDIRFDDRATQAANDFKTRSATAEFEVAMYWTGETRRTLWSRIFDAVNVMGAVRHAGSISWIMSIVYERVCRESE